MEIKDKEKKLSWFFYFFYLYYLLCFMVYINIFWGVYFINLDLIKVFIIGLYLSMFVLYIYIRVV